jgi:hypothetical protein
VNREKIADATAHTRAAIALVRAAIDSERDCTIRSPLLDAIDALSLATIQLEVAAQFAVTPVRDWAVEAFDDVRATLARVVGPPE